MVECQQVQQALSPGQQLSSEREGGHQLGFFIDIFDIGRQRASVADLDTCGFGGAVAASSLGGQPTCHDRLHGSGADSGHEVEFRQFQQAQSLGSSA